MGSISRLSIIKFLELVLAVACLSLHYHGTANEFTADTISVASYGGYIIILIGAFAGHLMSTPINRRIDIFFSLAGCALFVAAGALNIERTQQGWGGSSKWKDYMLAKGSLSIINGAFFLLDALLTWRGDF